MSPGLLCTPRHCLGPPVDLIRSYRGH
jgi:hypothetical protein